MSKLTVAKEALDKLGIKKALTELLGKAKADDVIEYPDELIEKAPFELRKAIADHNTQAMPDGQAYRDSFDWDGFHGTPNGGAIESFDTGRIGENFKASTGIHASNSANEARHYAGDFTLGETTRNGQILPIKVNSSGADVVDIPEGGGRFEVEPRLYNGKEFTTASMFADLERPAVERLLADGSGAVHIRKKIPDDWNEWDGASGLNENMIVSDPSRIRSRFAAFDPAKRNSTNILASAAPAAVGLGLLGGQEEAEAGVKGKAGELLMDTASRLTRAKEQGFDTSRPVYHGTQTDFDEFDPDRAIGTQFWSTTDRAAIDAGEVGAQGKGVVKEMYHNIQNPAGWEEYDKFGIDEMIARGHDGVALPDSDGQITYIAFKPEQYRHTDAAFDPKNVGKPNLRGNADPTLLAGIAGTGTAALAAPTAMDYLQHGMPQPQPEAKAGNPYLGQAANAIDGIQGPFGGALLDTSGLARWLRELDQPKTTGQRAMNAIGAQPF